MSLPKDFWQTRAAPLILVGLALGVYGNTFGVPFLLDDVLFIVESESIRTLAVPFLGGASAGPNWIDFRPVADLSFRLNYQISGLEVWSYHWVNFSIHAVNACLLYGIFQQILAAHVSARMAQGGALAAAAVWVVHPIHINAVTYISQRFESMAAMFALAAVAAFLRSRMGGSQRGQWWCIFFVLMSFGSKETNLAIPILVWLMDRFWLPQTRQDRIRRLPFYGALGVTWLFAAVLFAFSQRSSWTTSEGAESLFSIGNLKIQSVVIMHYLGKLLWPVSLVFDEGKWPAPTLLQWLSAAGILGVTFGWATWAVFQRKLWGLAVVSFFLLLGPSSSLVVVPTYDAADYRMYLPSAPLMALAMVSLCLLFSRLEGRNDLHRFTVVVALLVFAFGFVTWRRNQLYNSPVALWSDNAIKRPWHSGSYVGLGEALMRENRLTEAEEILADGIEKFPTNARLLNLAGMVAIQAGREGVALEFWERAHEMAPQNHVILNNLAIAAFKRGDWVESERLFDQVVALRPHDVIALGNLAQVKVAQGKLGEAQGLVDRGIKSYPQDIVLRGLRQRIEALLLKSETRSPRDARRE